MLVPASLRKWVFQFNFFNAAFHTLWIATAVFAGATAFAVFNANGIGSLILLYLLFHAAVVGATQLVLRQVILPSGLGDRLHTDEEYSKFARVVLQNSAVLLVIYLMFALTTVTIETGQDNAEIGVAFILLAVCAGAVEVWRFGWGTKKV